MRRRPRLLPVTVLSFPLLASPLALPAAAQAPKAAMKTATAPAPTKPAGPVKVTTVEGITEYRLDNGFRILLFPDASKPTVTVNVTYIVGSRHEGYGETGMAHLLEHMLFKGTPSHPDIWKLLQDRGAKFNGTTWYDRTNYYEELPASPENLEFAIALEADRMVNSKIAKEDLEKEFSVVRNEFEMGENNPAGVLEEKMMAAAFQWHNYGKTTIGSRSDIERVPIENLRAFYRKYYQPDNALLIVAGKFDEKQALDLAVKHFGALPRPARGLQPTWTVEPPQDGERAVTLRRNGDVSVVAVAYHGVAGPSADWIAEDTLVEVLTNKPAGRLYKALVGKGLATEVFGYVYPTAEPGVMYFGAKVRQGGSPEKVRDAMLKTIESLATDPITSEELERWRTRANKEFELAMTDTASIGVALSDWAAMGDWRLFFLTRDRVKDVKADDVTRVAKTFLKETNRTVGMFIPTKAPDRPPLVEAPDVADMMKDYKGQAAVEQGEVFVATVENIEARTTRLALDNGLKVALLPKKTKGGAVRVVLTLRYGSEKDLGNGKTSAAGIIPQMLLRGTVKRSFQQIKDEFDRLKAEVSFGMGRFSVATPGVTQVRIKTTRENLPAVLGLMGEVLRQPAFPKTEFETLRKEALAQLEEQRQDPMAAGYTMLTQKILPAPKDDVRYVPTVAETIERLKAVKLPEVVALHKTLWGADSAQVALVGDLDADAIKGVLTKELGTWKAKSKYERIARPYREGQATEEALDTPDKEMAFVGVGHPMELRDDDPDYPALVMVNHLLGGSASSRLLNRLRQKEGLSYGAFSGLQANPLDRSGYFFAGAICAPQNADKAMKLMLEEIDAFLANGVPAKELDDAKKSYAATWENRLAEDDYVAGELAQGLFLGRTLTFWKGVNDRIAKLTPDEVLAAAKKHLRRDKLAKVKAGDLGKGEKKT